MARVYIIGLIAIGLCLTFLYLSEPPLQEKVEETYYITNKGTYYWDKFKQPLVRLLSKFFPGYNLIQKKMSEQAGEERLEGEAMTLTQAAEKSVEKTKSTLEDSAKSAAEMAAEAAHKTKDAIKETLSKGTPDEEL